MNSLMDFSVVYTIFQLSGSPFMESNFYFTLKVPSKHKTRKYQFENGLTSAILSISQVLDQQGDFTALNSLLI